MTATLEVNRKNRARGRRLAAVVIVVGLLIATVAFVLRFQQTTARDLLDRKRWSEARKTLGWLLKIRPGNSTLRLMMAESYAKDDSGSAEGNASAAIEHMRQIPDQAPEGPDARMYEARLTFLVLRRPYEAERLVRHALKLTPSSADARLLLWTILGMTGREELAEPVFRELYDLGPAAARLGYLRNWYFSQIDPLRMTASLDERMGFRESETESTRRVELKRLLAIRALEPEEPSAHAAVARWFQAEGDPEQALLVLEQGDRLPTARDDSFFVATFIDVLIEAGQFERAAELLKLWQEPHPRHAYLRLQGILREDLDRDYRAAADAYSQAETLWPGPTDWKCRFRFANCLTLIGESARAEEVRHRAEQVRDLFSPRSQDQLRKALEGPDRRENLERILDFYRILGREDEVSFWRATAGT